MADYFIRPMALDEFEEFFQHIEQDFSRGEYAPYPVLYQQLEEGVHEGLVLCEGIQKLAYSICAAAHKNGYVLVSLLAVFKEYRGQGIGSVFLEALCKRYDQKQAVMVEVEKPECAETREERDFRERRIAFYEKAGFYLITGIDYSIWDVPMHLMVRPITAANETINREVGQIMYDIYLSLMGKRYIDKMKFRKIE